MRSLASTLMIAAGVSCFVTIGAVIWADGQQPVTMPVVTTAHYDPSLEKLNLCHAYRVWQERVAGQIDNHVQKMDDYCK